MKKFVKEIKKEINCFNFETMSMELKDLAIIKYVLIKLSNICSRDDRFFLYKENISLRRKIYNKHLIFNKKGIKISCRSYCIFVQKILKKLEINTILFSAGKDEFKHFALIYAHKNKKYYIDPLHDLVNLKIGAKTQYFCYKYDKIHDLTDLNIEQHEKINKIIGYKEQYNDFLKTLPSNLKLCDIDDIIKNNILSSSLVSASDFIIFLNKFVNDSILSKYKEKIKVSYCVTLKKIKLHDKCKLKKGLNGLCIQYFDKTKYWFPSVKHMINDSILIKYIYTKPKYDIKTYKYFKENNVNRQILDNIYFQKIIYDIENIYNIEQSDIEIINDIIFIKKLNIEFYIYKYKYLCMKTNEKVVYFIIKNFGQIIIKKQLK